MLFAHQACHIPVVPHWPISSAWSYTGHHIPRSWYHSMYAPACVDELVAIDPSCIEDVQGMLDSLWMNHCMACDQGFQLPSWYLQGRGVGASWFAKRKKICFQPIEALSSCIIAQCCFNHLGVVSSGSLVQSRLNSTELRDFICCSLSRSSCTMGWEFWKSNCVPNVRCMQAVTPPKNVGPSKETKKNRKWWNSFQISDPIPGIHAVFCKQFAKLSPTSHCWRCSSLPLTWEWWLNQGKFELGYALHSRLYVLGYHSPIFLLINYWLQTTK